MLALDALRGLAILAMLLSGQLPFDRNALPSWMYHAQVPPPLFEFQPTLPGITWVDLVFPFFLFSMGAAIPLALSRRMETKAARWKLALFVIERGFLLGFFALFVQAIRPYTISHHPGFSTWVIALMGFLILFPILTRLPKDCSNTLKSCVRLGGWGAAVLFCALVTYPDGSRFQLTRSDIIIVVLANMAVFGALAWMLTRNKLLARLGVMGILLAVRLSNLPQPTEGWVRTLWEFSPAPWLYRLYYLQYLFIVIPGTIAGDLLLQWLQSQNQLQDMPKPGWPRPRYLAVCIALVAMPLVCLVGLKARWVVATTIGVFILCLAGWKLLSSPVTPTELLYRRLFRWAVYWLVLGLFLEPCEGGIKKDHPTLSYYFVTSGLAICVLIAFSIFMDVFGKHRWVKLLVDNGQNPMIAYAGINNFIIPILGITGGGTLLARFASAPWRGFIRGAIITALMALVVSFLTRRRIFWRT